MTEENAQLSETTTQTRTKNSFSFIFPPTKQHTFHNYPNTTNNIHFTSTHKPHTFYNYPKTTYISQLPQNNIHFTTTPKQHTFHNYPKTTYISPLHLNNIHFTTTPKQHTFHKYPGRLFIAYYSSIHSFISHWIFAICYWPKHQCSVTSSLIHATQNFPYYRKSKPMIFFFDFVRFMFFWFLSTLTTFSHMLVVFVHSKLTDLMHYN